MKHVWAKIEELRAQYELLRRDRTPIDVFTFFELDLGLDAIPFDGLTSEFCVEAAIKSDFTGIYLDAEQYAIMEKGPDWKLNRLRFTIAHELGHYFLHREIVQAKDFESFSTFSRWTESYGGKKYELEQEANEFAGRLLVSETTLGAYFDEFSKGIKPQVPNFQRNGQLRDQFAEGAATHFGVNPQVISVRLERDGIWCVS